jgi:hypothetical protein
MGASCLHSDQIWVHGPSPCKRPVNPRTHHAQPRPSQQRLERRLGRSESQRSRAQASIVITPALNTALRLACCRPAVTGQHRKRCTIAPGFAIDQILTDIPQRSLPRPSRASRPASPHPARRHHGIAPAAPRAGGVTRANAVVRATSIIVMPSALQLCNLTLGYDRVSRAVSAPRRRLRPDLRGPDGPSYSSVFWASLGAVCARGPKGCGGLGVRLTATRPGSTTSIPSRAPWRPTPNDGPSCIGRTPARRRLGLHLTPMASY